jgi:hypothetical protein
MSALAATKIHGENMVPQPHGGALRPFAKGNKASPGRPAGIAAYAKKQTKDGKELVDFMLSVLRLSGEFEHARVPLLVRMEAVTWLADQAFGKPVQRTEMTGKDGGPLEVEHGGAIEVRAVDYRVTTSTLRPQPAVLGGGGEEEGAA